MKMVARAIMLLLIAVMAIAATQGCLVLTSQYWNDPTWHLNLLSGIIPFTFLLIWKKWGTSLAILALYICLNAILGFKVAALILSGHISVKEEAIESFVANIPYFYDGWWFVSLLFALTFVVGFYNNLKDGVF